MTPMGAAEAGDVAAEAKSPRRLWAVKIALGLAVLVGLLWLGREAGEHVPRFAAWVDGLGPWGPAAFVAGYGLAVVASCPAPS